MHPFCKQHTLANCNQGIAWVCLLFVFQSSNSFVSFAPYDILPNSLWQVKKGRLDQRELLIL
jgi:hypothetical protein